MILPQFSFRWRPDLFNLVKQGFVTDLQFTGGPLAVPPGTFERLHDQFTFRFLGSSASRNLQRTAL